MSEDHRASPSRPGQWVLSSPGGGGSIYFQLGPGTFLLGAASGADLRIPHPTVSRQHARITASAGELTIEDLGSANGTMVDGERIDGSRRLEPGAALCFGDVHLVLGSIETISIATPRPIRPGEDHNDELLGPTTIGLMRSRGQELGFGRGDVIIRRGTRQDSFYVVVAGEVEIFLQEGHSRRRPLARLGAGATFGIESALAEEGAAVDAVALTDVRVLQYPSSALDAALRESASLRSKLLGGMARHLHEAAGDALDLLKGAEVITRLVQGNEDPDDLIAVSARMRAIRNRIDSCAKTRSPVLVLGDAGTGKTLVARLIHQASARSKGPLIVVSCRQLRPDNAAELILGSVNLPDSSPGTFGSGGVHFADGGTLVLRDVDTLGEAVQRELTAYLERVQSQRAGSIPDTRIVMTARSVPNPREKRRGHLSQGLLGCVGDLLQIPSLAERPKDIVPLAEAMLASSEGVTPRLTDTARHALVSMPFRHNNVAELREVVQLAARIADDPEIGAEHIIGGAGHKGVVPGVNLTASPLMAFISNARTLRWLRWSTAAGFAAAIVLCFAFASSAAGRAANTAIWAVWEPVVFALFLVIGPVWCTVCPLSTAGRAVKRIKELRRPPPEWMVTHGPWLTIIGFVAIVWSERVFHMTNNPAASAVMLTTLVAAAVGFGLIYRREVWCRHLCPLGRLAVALAPASPLQLTARNSICASTCQTHECYKGNSSIPGCTVFHHPLETTQAHHCKLCLDCLQSCPHGSVRVEARAPLRAIWNLDGGSSGVAMFGYTISLVALVLLIPFRFPSLAEPLWFSCACVLALAGGVGLKRAVDRLVGNGDRNAATSTQVGIALMILGWGALLLSQLSNIPLLAHSRIELAGPGIAPFVATTGLSGLMLVQIIVMIGAAGGGLFTLRHIRRTANSGSNPSGLTPWRAVQLVFVVYTLVAVYLVL